MLIIASQALRAAGPGHISELLYSYSDSGHRALL